MSSFTAAQTVWTGRTNAAGRRVYRVDGAEGDGFVFWVGNPVTGQRVHVREGFTSDLASWLSARTRRVLRWVGLAWLVGWVDDCLAKAAIVHDRLREDLQYTLEDCDALFLSAMTADLPNWRGPLWARRALREAAFLAVRTNTSRVKHNG